MSESMPWPTTSWGEPSVSSQQPQPIRFGNNDYMLVPINQGGGLQQQIWTQRSELQRFDSESLKKVKEYRYKKLPGGKKRERKKSRPTTHAHVPPPHPSLNRPTAKISLPVFPLLPSGIFDSI